jgi:uncharacterized protein
VRASTLENVDALALNLDRGGRGQLYVVVVDSTEDEPSRQYALDLFRRWGIGHRLRHDGVLLLFSLEKKNAEILLGRNLDNLVNTRRSKVIMEQDILPAFRRGDLDTAILGATRGLGGLVLESDLNVQGTPNYWPPAVNPSFPVVLPDAGTSDAGTDVAGTVSAPPGAPSSSPIREGEAPRSRGGWKERARGPLGIVAALVVAVGVLGIRRALRNRKRQ